MQKATRQQTKTHNRSLVLKIVFAQDGLSRADIARKTGLTRTTVSEIFNDLISEGLVFESGPVETAIGKPPIRVHLNAHSRQIICADLSADTLHGALMNLHGEISHQEHLPLHGSSGEYALEKVYTLLDRLTEAASAPILGIGIGTPGLVDTTHGVIRQAIQRDWYNLPLQALLAERYPYPVHLVNDSHAAALGEYTFGGETGSHNLVVIKAGQGISAGVVLDGRLITGDSFSAGEIGHLVVVPDGDHCSCGNFGCLETVAGRRGLLNNFYRAGEALNLSLPYPPSLENLLQAYSVGNPAALQAVKAAGEALGSAVASLIGVTNVQRIVIAGDLVPFGEDLLLSIRRAARQRILPTLVSDSQFSFSKFAERCVLFGAGALVLAHELGLP